MAIDVATPAGMGVAPAVVDLQARLLEHLGQAGFDRIEPPVLQDAAVFLDLGGEDIRASLFLTGDGSGADLCLRPEYTIPACRAYLAGDPRSTAAAFCYGGPVFRQGTGRKGESLQAGLEIFGRPDTAAADAEILYVALDAVRAAGAPPLSIAMGDAGLVSSFLDAIDMPPLWQRRLRRGLERGRPLDDILAGAPSPQGERAGVSAALTGANGSDARALVEDLLSVAGIAAVGGRSVGEIADRFLSQVAQQASPGFGVERQEMLARFLAVTGDPDSASDRLRHLVRDMGLDLASALDLFDERVGYIAAQEIDLSTIGFSTGFARNLDYYTGFVFEARPAGRDDAPVLVGGGRYDRLAQALGSDRAVPAVGAAIWTERLAEALVS